MRDPGHRQEGRRAGWSYCGEAWTDAEGRASVALPPAGRARSIGFVYDLSPTDPAVTAELVAELHDGVFVLGTDRPHSKVAWRLTELEQPTAPTTPGGTR